MQDLLESTGLKPECTCHACIQKFDLKDPNGIFPLSSFIMVLCPICGNKRCPKASNHELECTGSNEAGQKGSVYE